MISVIIPTTGRSFGLRRAIYSVLSQDIEDVELIVVDDSKDGLSERALSGVGSAANIRIVRSYARNPGGARNAGIELASQEYITFLDDDDIFLPGRIEKFLSNKEKLKEGYSFLTSGRIYSNDDYTTLNTFQGPEGDVVLDDIIYKNTVDIAFFCRRELLVQVGGFDVNLTGLEDLDLLIRMLTLSPGFRLRGSDLVVFQHKMDNRVSESQASQRLKIADKHREMLGRQRYARMIAVARYQTNSLSIPESFNLARSALGVFPIYYSFKLLLTRLFSLSGTALKSWRNKK